jgi:hypothetical protein
MGDMSTLAWTMFAQILPATAVPVTGFENLLSAAAAEIQLLRTVSPVPPVSRPLPMFGSGLPLVAGLGEGVDLRPAGPVSRRVKPRPARPISRRVHDDIIAAAAPVDAAVPISTPIRDSGGGQ